MQNKESVPHRRWTDEEILDTKEKILAMVREASSVSGIYKSDIYSSCPTDLINLYRLALTELIKTRMVFLNDASGKITAASSTLYGMDVSAKELRRQRRETIRYWITTAIAVIALILAVISLLAQLGLLQLPTP